MINFKGMVLEASTVDQLDDNIRRAFPDTTKRQNVALAVPIKDINYVDYPANNALKVVSTCQGKSGTYNQAVLFKDVVFVTKQDETTTTVSASGKLINFRPISLVDSKVEVKCDCLDFQYRFAHYNNQDKSLYGKPPEPYVRKTDNRPPVNPMQVPGVCKHILKLLDTLQQRDVVI